FMGGTVIVQPDLSNSMLYSGVAYTNLNGKLTITLGNGSAVQQIVRNSEDAYTTITINNETVINGKPVDPSVVEAIRKGCMGVEQYFGRPMDIEFAMTRDGMTFLQARPLPNPTEDALREFEIRRIARELSNATSSGLKEIVLGVGNYREILGDSAATNLSVSTFNYIFSGNGKDRLGAVQLGRSELGYDVGYEAYPWVVYAGGKVYYNFAGDALQFRPKGITLEDFMQIINDVYIPMAKGNPDLLNYPELRIYAQFPEEAEALGMNPAPFV
ncbi:Pyruvate phosphate dikinase, PEP/pyruvate-binding domain protein, partial [mine drainage metagenome]